MLIKREKPAGCAGGFRKEEYTGAGAPRDC
jgi:hypothetical protein